jgi:hypothetical protein
VITRLEHGSQGNNPRFVVTNLEGNAVQLYERLYCARGEAENRIKEAQLDLFGTRASCHRFAANQLRLLLAALAYTLMQRLRELALKGTELERATAATIRTRLLKIGAAIVRNTRRVRVLLASHHHRALPVPWRGLRIVSEARLATSRDSVSATPHAEARASIEAAVSACRTIPVLIASGVDMWPIRHEVRALEQQRRRSLATVARGDGDRIGSVATLLNTLRKRPGVVRHRFRSAAEVGAQRRRIVRAISFEAQARFSESHSRA